MLHVKEVVYHFLYDKEANSTGQYVETNAQVLLLANPEKNMVQSSGHGKSGPYLNRERGLDNASRPTCRKWKSPAQF